MGTSSVETYVSQVVMPNSRATRGIWCRMIAPPPLYRLRNDKEVFHLVTRDHQ
jgi:hypothetical protein